MLKKPPTATKQDSGGGLTREESKSFVIPASMIEKDELVLPDTPSKALRASDAPLANYKDNNNFDVDINELDLEFEE